MSLVEHVNHGLVVVDAAGEPSGLVTPGDGEVVSLADAAGVGRWLRIIMDIEQAELVPLKRVAYAALYQAMDATGDYTIHTDDGLKIVGGESRAAFEHRVVVDADALHADLISLRRRESAGDADQFADDKFTTKRTLTAAGRNKLIRMGGEYAELVAAHTTPDERHRERRAPTVTRTTTSRSR